MLQDAQESVAYTSNEVAQKRYRIGTKCRRMCLIKERNHFEGNKLE